MDGPSRDKLLANVRAQDPRLAAELTRRVWTLEEVAKLDPADTQLLLREIPGKTLALALRKASDTLKEHLYANLSPRAAEALKEDIAALGPQKLSKVEWAHEEIEKILKQMIASGRIQSGK